MYNIQAMAIGGSESVESLVLHTALGMPLFCNMPTFFETATLLGLLRI